MSADIRFNNENCSFGLRTVGILFNGNKVLLQREKDGYEYALPGGTVKFGETTEETLIREWKEETDTNIKVKRLIWTEENFWEWNGQKQHGIAFYYLVDFLGDSSIPETEEFISQRDNCNVVLGWMPLDEIKNITLYPEFAKKELFSICDKTKHFISKE